MKKIFLLIAINLVVVSAMAQFKITLIMSTTPPATLSEWGNRREVLTLLVNTQGSAGAEAKIKTEIKTMDGTVIGTTDLARARTVAFTTTNTILTANDVLPLDNMIFTGKYRSSLDKTGKLPSDNYTLCVQLVRPVDYTPASEQQCKNFFLATLQLPILMKPYDEEKLDSKAAQTAITFRWTPVVPQQREAVTYHIQVFEVLDYQTPMQALRANQPLLDATVRGATQYIWRPQLGDIAKSMATSEDTLGTGKATFIWTIQTLDAVGNPIIQTDGNGEARSEPIKFYIVPNTNNQQKTKDKPKPIKGGLKDTLKTQV